MQNVNPYKNNILSAFAESLNELLQNTSLPEFSAQVDISLAELHKYLRGVSLPNLRNAIKSADHFSCSLSFLMGLVENTGNTFCKAPPFSVAFRNALTKTNCTRYRLSKDSQIARQSIDDWYHGRREPSMDNILRVAKSLDCTLDFLVGRE